MTDEVRQAGPTVSFGDRELDLSRPRVMGVLNITPDSFSDGGDLFAGGRPSLDRIRARAARMVEAGADFIDVGGESTRPGAAPVETGEELERVLPVVEALRAEFDVVISVDTSNPALIRRCAGVGAGLINDVRALRREGALDAAAASGLPVCLMHMQGEPGNMQDNPVYGDIVRDITEFLKNRVEACRQAGMDGGKILLDPGFGFGKTLNHNLELLGRLEELSALHLPLLVGLSRKRMIGTITGREAKARMPGSVAAAVIAVMKGASIVRTHDVAETVDAVKVCTALITGLRRSADGET